MGGGGAKFKVTEVLVRWPHKMEVAFLSSFEFVVVVVRHLDLVLLVSCGQQRQLHIRLTE